MRLPQPSPQYEMSRQADMNRTLEQADRMNVKRGQDIELSRERLILRSPNGTRYAITVDNAGNIGAEAL